MAETKEKIIATAQKLFARFGMNKTTVDEIARISHVAKGTIYHYFKSKEEIFEEVINREEFFLQSEIRKSLSEIQSPKDKLRIFVITRFKNLKNLSNYYGVLKDEYLSNYSFIEKARKKNYINELAIVSSILKKGCEDNVFAVKNIDLTALAIVTALKGLEYPWTIEKPIEEIEENLDILLNILFNGIEYR